MFVTNNPVVIDIAKECGKSVAQVALKWALQRGYAIIPKSTKEERQKENLDLFNWELSEDQMKRINTLDLHHRFNNLRAFDHPIYD